MLGKGRNEKPINTKNVRVSMSLRKRSKGLLFVKKIDKKGKKGVAVAETCVVFLFSMPFE